MPTHAYIDVDGAQLYCEVDGSGPAVVLIHGFTLDTTMWDDQFAPLARHFTVVRYDLRGFGRSTVPGATSYSHSHDLAALLDRLAIPQAVLVGLSKGGAIALDFALTYPERTAALALIDAVVGGYRWSPAGAARNDLVLQVARTEGIAAAKASWLAHPIFAPAQRSPQVAARLAAIVDRYSGWHFVNDDPEQRLTPRAAGRLAELSMPILVMVGEYDTPDFQHMADLLYREVPHAQKYVVRDAGHMANMEAPAAVTEGLVSFLTQRQHARTSPMATQSGYLTRDNARLYYEVAGEGQPVVLLHAGVADIRQWNNEFGALARHYRVLRYDMRGFGKSDPVPGDFSHLADLVALLDHVGFAAPAVLIGCSQGGMLAMIFALEHPSRARALVMVGSFPSGFRLATPDHPQAAAAAVASEAGDLDLLAELQAQIWFDGMGRTPDQVDGAMRSLMLAMNRIALTNQARTSAQHLGLPLLDTAAPAVERLAELHVPVLVIIGDHDIPYIQAAAAYMLTHIPTAHRATIPDAGHLPNLDHPDRFMAAIVPFLASI